MLFGLFENIVGCMSDFSIVVHFWRIQHGAATYFGKSFFFLLFSCSVVFFLLLSMSIRVFITTLNCCTWAEYLETVSLPPRLSFVSACSKLYLFVLFLMKKLSKKWFFSGSNGEGWRTRKASNCFSFFACIFDVLSVIEKIFIEFLLPF